MEFQHVSVLLNECMEALAVRPDGVYLDGTLGGAGHSREIARRLTSGRLIGVDRDPAALRAAEMEADIIFKASMVDGVYDKDPKKYPDAVKYDELSYLDVLNRDLKVMDSTAATMCRDNNIPILVFNLNDPRNIVRAVCGEPIGTVVHG